MAGSSSTTKILPAVIAFVLFILKPRRLSDNRKHTFHDNADHLETDTQFADLPQH
jgi:hypothetical protein